MTICGSQQTEKKTIIMREKEDNKEAKSRKDEPEVLRKKRTINRNATREGRITLLQINAQSPVLHNNGKGKKTHKKSPNKENNNAF